MTNDVTAVLLLLILVVLGFIAFGVFAVKEAVEDNTDWHRDNYEGEK